MELENYKILRITLDTLFRWPFLDLDINLDNFRTNDNGFFTLSGIDSRAGLKVGDSRFEGIIKFDTKYAYYREHNVDEELIINEFKHYFLTEDFSSLEIFELKMLPTDASDVPSFGVTELNETCVMLRLANKFEDIRNQFTDSLYQIIYREFSKNRRCSRLQDFWSLQLINNEITWEKK